jgi:hypothetical protein
MDHETAVQIKASEKYVLGELSSLERNEFEEHFSDCARCLEDVWTTSAFAANAKAVFAERAVARPARKRISFQGWSWARPLPALAAVALAAFIGFQNVVVIPALRAPQSMRSAVILDGEVRASLPQLRPGDAARFQLALDRAPEHGRVIAELTDSSGKILSRGPLAAPGADRLLDIYFPVQLHPGRYAVVIREDEAGQSGRELARNPFEVVSQEAKTQ